LSAFHEENKMTKDNESNGHGFFDTKTTYTLHTDANNNNNNINYLSLNHQSIENESKTSVIRELFSCFTLF
jgi:hypothetical protein